MATAKIKTHRKTRPKLHERVRVHSKQRNRHNKAVGRTTPNEYPGLGRDFVTPIAANGHIKKAIKISKVIDHIGPDILSAYPHKTPIELIRYLYKCVKNLPFYYSDPQKAERDIMKAIKDQDSVTETAAVLMEVIHTSLETVGRSEEFDSCWGSIGHQLDGNLGTISNPAKLNIVIANPKTNYQQAAFTECSFLPDLIRKDKKLHDILVRAFSLLAHNIQIMTFGNYADWGVAMVKEMTGQLFDDITSQVEYNNARLEAEKSPTEKPEDPEEVAHAEPDIIESYDAIDYWTSHNQPVFKYRKLINKVYSLKGTKARIRNYPWKRRKKQHLKDWLDRLITAVEKKLNIRDYDMNMPSFADNDIQPCEYYCLRWGIEDSIENMYDEDIQSRWQETGFSPFRRVFDLADEPLKFVKAKKTEHPSPDWGSDTGAEELCLLLRDASQLFDRYSAMDDFDMEKIDSRYKNLRKDHDKAYRF